MVPVLCTLLVLAAPGDMEKARALFEEGRAALSTGRFAEARDLFKSSLSLTPKPGSAFNLAVALRGVGESLEAVATLEQLLAGEYGTISKKQREEAELLRVEAKKEIATITVRVEEPANVELRIDGVLVSKSTGEHLVDAGAHVLSASAPGHETSEQKLEVERGGRAELVFRLAPLARASTGTLIAEGEPEDLLTIAGHASGKRLLERALPPGRYQLSAEGPSGRRTLEAQVVAGETVRVRIEPSEGGLFESPWFWIAAGAVIAGGVVAGVLIANDAPDPIRDPTYGVIQTLRF